MSSFSPTRPPQQAPPAPRLCRTILQCSRSSMYRAPRFERGGCGRNSCREHHFSPCSPTEEALRLERSQCGCKLPLLFGEKSERLSRYARLCHGDFQFCSRSPTAEAAGLNPVQCRCESDREHQALPNSRGTASRAQPVQVQVAAFTWM